MTFEADLDVFYGPPFGVGCARRRSAVDDIPFRGILGSVDELALEGYAVTAEYGLRYPTAEVDLDEGDRVLVGCNVDADGAVVLVAGIAQGGTAYKVRTEPRRINDGAETAAILSSIPT